METVLQEEVVVMRLWELSSEPPMPSRPPPFLPHPLFSLISLLSCLFRSSVGSAQLRSAYLEDCYGNRLRARQRG